MFTRKDLVRLIVPLIIEQVLAATIGIADTLMVASVGEVAVSGVSLVDSINILLLQVFAALSTGGAIVAAQYLGREDAENANRAARQLMVVTTLVAAGLGAVCLAVGPAILHLLFGSAEQAVMQSAQTYFWLSALGYPLIAIYNVSAALFRVQGNSRISMFAALVMNVTNIGFKALLIFVFRMGVAGAALGSLIARMCGTALLLFFLRNPHNRLHLDTLRGFRFDREMIRNILRLGIPNGLENGIFHIGKIIVAGLIASFGTVAIAANAVSNSILTMSQMPGSALGLAMVTVIGQCVGARDYPLAKKYMFGLTGVSYALMAALNLLMIFFLPPVIGCFGLSEETARAAWEVCVVCCIGNALIWPASFTLPNGLRAANDVKVTMIVSVLSMWIFRVGFSYILGAWLGMGLLGTWLAMIIDWVARAVVFTVRTMGGKWQYIKGV